MCTIRPRFEKQTRDLKKDEYYYRIIASPVNYFLFIFYVRQNL